jgi:hypothetical protein
MNQKVVPLRPLGVSKKNAPFFSWQATDLLAKDHTQWLNSICDESTNSHFLNLIWYKRPSLRLATEKLAQFITTKWPSENGKPLIVKGIEQAALNVAYFYASGEYARGNETGAYLTGLLGIHEELASLKIRGIGKDQKRHIWQPFSMTLYEWSIHKDLQLVEGFRQETMLDESILKGLRMRMASSIAGDRDTGLYIEHIENTRGMR